MAMETPHTPAPSAKEAKDAKDVQAEKPAADVLRLPPGEIIGERYRVVELLGEGGMGVVYRVEHTHMRKLFALKVLHRELLRMPEAVARFEREAVLAGSINHPNVAAATDFGKLPDGSFFLVLELVVGKSLREVIAEGRNDASRALGIMRGMAAGVAAAHAKGIVHRDLKPDNVMLVERDGVPDFVKVLDFGIAKGNEMPEARESATPLTQIGSIMGTPDYMSPEQALGQPVDARSDLYALGVIYFELLTGAAPFVGEALQVLRQHIMTEAPPVPADRVSGVNVPLAEIVAKLLAKEPDARFQNATELLSALDGTASIAKIKVVVNGGAEPSPAPPSTSAAAAAAPSAVSPSTEAKDDDRGTIKGLPRRAVIAAASLGVLVLVVVVVMILSGRSDPASAETEHAGMVQSAAPAGSADDPAPSASTTSSATAAATEEAEQDTPESAPSSAPLAPGAARRPSAPPPAAARGGQGTARRPAPAPAPAPRRTERKKDLLRPLKDLFN
jgi:eukaryotic-like serine/threonine-protein kinase